MATALMTKDHEMIRRWAEERDGHPAIVRGREGLIRIDFGEPEGSLEEITWDEFFEYFDDNDLTFLYDPDKDSRFNKFVRGGEAR